MKIGTVSKRADELWTHYSVHKNNPILKSTVNNRLKKSKVTIFKTNLYIEDRLIKLYSQMTSSLLNSIIGVSYRLAHKFIKLDKRHQN